MFIQKKTMFQYATLIAAFCTLAVGCDSPPRNHYIHWVTRDAWEPGCAQQAAVEKIVVTNAHWKEEGKIYSVDVDATYKLINPCNQGQNGKSYRQFESVDFNRKGIEMVRCKRNGKEGWSLKDREVDLCWTGPKPPRYTEKTIKKKRTAVSSPDSPVVPAKKK
jgi:hypothetical protein